MTLVSKSIAGLTVLALAAPALTHAAETSVGQREYEGKCVSCHGAAGKGTESSSLSRSPSAQATNPG